MKGKLYKTNNDTYILVDLTKGTYDKGYVLGTSRESDVNKLSIKNCQAIENGYDLDELAEKNTSDCDASGCYPEDVFKKGFQKALELMGDKKFSINEVVELCKILMSNPFEKCGKTYQELTDNYIQSLQQTEWDVEICCHIEEDNGWLDADTFNSPMLTSTGEPKLDADDCLILKRN